jgi:predicted transcriptional regulator
MKTALLLPIGIAKETVYGVMRYPEIKPDVIITITVRGLEEVKSEILSGVTSLAELMGIPHYHVSISYGDTEAGAKIYNLLKTHKPQTIVVSGVTGSRYLFPIVAQVLLLYWHEYKARILLIHGIEGESWELAPFIGFFTYNLKRRQKEIFELIYQVPKDIIKTKEELIEKYRLGRHVYTILKELEMRGLIARRRNKIIKTMPGYLLYNLLKSLGEVKHE